MVIGILSFIIQRSEYLSHLEAGSQYLKIYRMRELEKFLIFAFNFVIVFFLMYFTTRKMQSNLKDFFIKEEKEFPNLPKKSISFVIALVLSLIAQIAFAGDFLKLFNMSWFGKKDPIMGMDYSYYILVIPIIKKFLLYLLSVNIITLIYVVIYNILTINIKLDGIELAKLKNSKISKQVGNIIISLLVLLSLLIFTFIPNILVGDMFKTQGKDSFYLTGASFTDIYFKVIGYIILPFLIMITFFKFKKAVKLNNYSKAIKLVLVIPIYILIIYLLVFLVQITWINRDRLNNESKYIRQNIIETKTAFNLDLEDRVIEKSEILDSTTILQNQKTVNSIPIVAKEIVNQTLNENDTNFKTYKYNNSQLINNFDSVNKLVYFTPREIDSKKSNNGSIDYTHGNYGIITEATNVDEKGGIDYVDRTYTKQFFKNIMIEEPRIYYGTETDSIVLTKTKSGPEYDFPITTSKVEKNTYEGVGGLKLKVLDRLVLGIKTSSPNIIFNSKIKEDTKILFNRNITKRAKNILPEIQYDKNPYMIVSENGRLIWVLDGYTTSAKYPYSQKLPVPTTDNRIRKINYIRNSVKVLIDAYDGTIDFYIDKTDPIILNIDNVFKNTFKSIDEIPKSLSKQFTYPRFMYDIQSEVIRKYHTAENDIFFSGEDVWEFSLLDDQSNKIREKKLNYTIYKNFDNKDDGIGYLTIFTPYGRQNINAYLIGEYEEGKPKLRLYQYSKNDNIPGIEFIKTQIRSEKLIKEELEELNVIGTEIKSYPMLIPINNSMLYVEPIYQVYVNRNNYAILKKIIVANGNKVGIGNNIQSAITNLFSDLAINIDIHDPLDRELIIEAIIRTNLALEKSMTSGNLENIGKYTQELNLLINQLKELDERLLKKADTSKNKTNITNQNNKTDKKDITEKNKNIIKEN